MNRMDSTTRVMRTLDFLPVDRIARFDGYSAEFEEACRRQLGLAADADLYALFGIDIHIAVPDETTWPGRAETVSETAGGMRLARNGWGTMERSREGAYFTEEVGHLIETPEDLDRHPFEDPAADARYADFTADVAAQRAKGRCVFGKIGGPYIRSTFLRGQEAFLLDIAGDEGFARELASRVADHLLAVGLEELRRCPSLRDTGIWIYDDMGYNGGPMMSPRSFERILLPCYRRIVPGLLAAGARKVGLHSDGDVRPLLDMLVDAGISFLNPLEPRANMSIPDVLRRYGRKVACIGGMCNSDVLVNGPAARIEAQARDILELARDGGVVIGAHSIGPDIPVDHYLAYLRCIGDTGGTFRSGQ